MKKRLIIPIFIPFGGCPEICVFCDQRGITGTGGTPSPEEIEERIEAWLATWKRGGRIEAAFYGGTFTAIERGLQRRCLETAGRFLREGRIHGIRISTRPDCLDEEEAVFLKSMGVDTVELGAQSMVDRVLKLSGRGHSAGDTVRAVETLKKAGFKVGIQFMPGLPGDDEETIMETAGRVAALGPDFARVYPTLVMKGTRLERMYRDGRYRPWGLEEMVALCKRILALFEGSDIKIIRMGLHLAGTEGLVAGPYHPSFRSLVDMKSPKTGKEKKDEEDRRSVMSCPRSVRFHGAGGG